MGWFNQTISHLLSTWGYWAVSIGLLGENAGLPLPGETVLMLASFEAHKRSGLHIQWVILVGIATATIGDNVGFFLGRHYGEPLIRWANAIFPSMTKTSQQAAVLSAITGQRQFSSRDSFLASERFSAPLPEASVWIGRNS